MLAPDVHAVALRDTLNLEDRGKLFSGLYLVDGISLDFGPGEQTASFNLSREMMTCAELLQLPNAATIYPDAYNRCQERKRRATT